MSEKKESVTTKLPEGKLRIIPAEGIKVRDPLTRQRVKGSKVVDKSVFWLRRLRDGDVVEVK